MVKPNAKIAYPDLKVGVPSLLLCIEMAIFATLHLFAFPWKPYASGQKVPDYPLSPGGSKDAIGPKQGGFLGLKAFADAMNPWDLIKAIARGMRWLFVGVKHRESDASYKQNQNDLDLEPTISPDNSYKRNNSPLPIADEFRRSKFGMPGFRARKDDEGAALMAHAQPNPVQLNNTSSGYIPARQRYDANGQDISAGGREYDSFESSPDRLTGHSPAPPVLRRHDSPPQHSDIGMAVGEPEGYQSHVIQAPYPTQYGNSDAYLEQLREERRNRASPSQQWAGSKSPINPIGNPAAHSVAHGAMWGAQENARGKNDNEF